MRVIVAKNAGFCFGVRRAVELARKEARERGRVYTWGKLIHNESVIRDLSAEGILLLRCNSLRKRQKQAR